VEYHRDLGSEMSGYVRLDFNTTSHQDANFQTGTAYYNVGGYSLANLRFAFTQRSWRYSLFATNLLDKHAEMALPVAEGIDLSNQRRYALNRPRTIGIDALFKY
jgi:hypothetical protein